MIIPDLPGFGRSTPMPSLPHTTEGYTAFAQHFMAALGLQRPVLLGHSYGSIAAAHLAATHPDLISDLILINPIAVSPRAGWNRPFTGLVEAYYWLGIHLPGRAGDLVISSKTFNRLQSLTLTKTWHRPTRRAVYRHHLNDLTFPQHKHVISQSFADSLARTVLDDAARIRIRTLLIAGARDAIAPAWAQRRLHAKLPAAELVFIPRVGHLVHLETPEPAAAAIANFLG